MFGSRSLRDALNKGGEILVGIGLEGRHVLCYVVLCCVVLCFFKKGNSKGRAEWKPYCFYPIISAKEQ